MHQSGLAGDRAREQRRKNLTLICRVIAMRTSSRGLLAIIFALFSHKTPADILAIDADAQLARLDLDQHISPNRRNGVASVIRVIRAAAHAHLDPTAQTPS